MLKKCLVLSAIITLFSCYGYEWSSEYRSYQELVAREDIPPVLSSLDRVPCNPRATKDAQLILEYIAELSEDPYRATLSGQSCGHTYDSVQKDNLMGYHQQIDYLYEKTGTWPAMIALDYGHDNFATKEALSAANSLLIDYWNRGGLVSVGWSAHNPWLYIGADEEELGDWTYSRTQNLNLSQKNLIDLEDLWEENNPAHSIWMEMLDRVAGALLELQEAGVVVLFKPVQEMNGNWFWWGIHSHKDSPAPYVTFYRNIYTYFTDVKGLNNILWMYSPASFNPTVPLVENYIKPQMWNYPGDDVVDIIAPTAYNNDVYIDDYPVLAAQGKPLAMAELSPDHEENSGYFDTIKIIERLSTQYPGIAFWISWEDWQNGDGTHTYMSLGRNLNAKELLEDPRVLTREDLDWKN